MKVRIVNGSASYRSMFTELGFIVVDKKEEADLFCFTGGEDVTPSMYNSEKHPTTYSNKARDLEEIDYFTFALKHRIPMVGICRGGQFLNVMCGGSMYQNVESHTQGHHITDCETGEVVYASSTHHQMMKPSSAGHLVAFSNQNGLREWFEEGVWQVDRSEQDIEVVLYKKENCLCFQPHPEFGGAEYIGLRKYFASLLDRFLVNMPVIV